MAVRLSGSRMGEGTGGASNVVDDPNNPSFDAATHETGTDAKIRAMCEPHVFGTLNKWEQDFIMQCYGVAPLTRNQHIKISSIYKKYLGA